MAPIKEAVYATLLMNDAYLPGAMVLAHSLKDKGAKARLVVLATLDNLSASTITELKTIYDQIIPVNRIVNKHPANLYLMDRPDLISTFTKIELWRQTQFRQIVYIDADMVALRAPNELLNHDADFAAVPDIGWPDCFNSGLLVLRPNLGDYYSLLALAQRGISFDGADQGLLNMHFQDWQRLSFSYNCTPSANYQYIPAYRHFQSSINLVHFIGRDKPWTMGRDHKHTSGVYGELLGRWWSTYDKHYRVHTSYYSGQSRGSSSTVQDYVADKKTTSNLGHPSSQPQLQHQLPPTIHVQPPPEVFLATTELDMGDQQDPIQQMDQQDFEQRHFSAPQMEWDASRNPPPADSKPEASNLPSQIYEFNQDTTLFQPPRYPKPPKDMYYQVPSEPPRAEKPKPIFPWEEHAPKPTRVFPEERPPTPEPEPESEPTAADRKLGDTSENLELIRTSSSTSAAESDPWNSFTRTNAWDAMPEIERYVQAIAQARKGRVQVVHQGAPTTEAADQPSKSLPDTVGRPSMKVTDFPTAVERPSLPVTPAPRHPSFWGEERDEAGELPMAEGVPKQEDWVSGSSSSPQRNFASASASRSAPSWTLYWRCQFCGKQNPIQKLEELQQRQSEVLQTGPELKTKELPRREMPRSAVDTPAAPTSKVLSAGQPLRGNGPKDEASSGTDSAVAAKTTEKASSPAKLKSILKGSSFDLGGVSSGETSAPPKEVALEIMSPDVEASA